MIKMFSHEFHMNLIYHMLSRLFMMTALISLASSATSCDDDDAEAPLKEASVKLQAETATESSLTFKITPSDAEIVSYQVLAKDETLLSAEQLLNDGTAANAISTKSYTVSNLTPDTDYTVIAAAANKFGHSQVVTLPMKTLKSAASASISLEAVSVTPRSLVFKLTPTHATKAAYVCLPVGKSLPDAETILKEGIEADAAAAKEYEVKNLTPATTYIIAAVAINESGKTEEANLSMATETEIPARIMLEAGTSTINSLTFTLTPDHASEVAYMCIADNESLPDAETILKNGTKADAAAAKEYEVTELTPCTLYHIVAAAMGQTGVSEVARIDMKTAVPTPTVTLEAGEADVNTLTFSLTTTDAGKAAYMYVKQRETLPEAADILTKGTEVEPNKTVTCTLGELEAETEYSIIAAATGIDGQLTVTSEPLTMQTRPAPLKDPVIGDFYYSDGTWSTELNPDKTPIGIVFYTGIASEFKDNASFYKQKDGSTPMKTIHGYVVALQDATFVNGQNLEVYWSFFDGNYSGTCSADTKDFLGYTNTRSIVKEATRRGGLTKENDSFPATYYATTAYEKACPAPATSSGWFLPAAHQFKWIYDNVYFNKQGALSVWLEKSFQTLGEKATPLYNRDAEYWTSTEKYDSEAHSYWAYYSCYDSSNFLPGFIADYRKNSGMRVRSMLVF